MFEKKSAVVKIDFIANGEVNTAEVKFRPVIVQEMLYFGILHPAAYNYLLGQAPTALAIKRKEGGKEVTDFSEINALLDFMWSTVEEIKINGVKFEGTYKDLPDMLVAQMLVQFRIFNFLSQADVDFFEKIQGLLDQSQSKPETSERLD